MTGFKKSALSTLALSAALGWTSALAQDASSDEVVVTASRVSVSGFTAPTPTTTLSTAEVQRVAPVQISEALMQMPSFRFSTTSSSPAVTANLRAVGKERTLVLVDGRRHVPTQGDGTMDLNLIPAALIQRTEVVTGGASASWGSDAVAGVVNLILDTKLQGFKGSVQAGQSKYGDAANWTLSFGGGTGFAGGRGHIVFGGEYSKDEGIPDLATPTLTRPWAFEERGQVANANFATNGQPGVIYSRGVRRADTTVGGLITVGPLRGTNFNSDGTTSAFGYGGLFSNNMIGGASNFGESVLPGSDIRYPFERYSAMTHAEFDVSDKVTAFGEVSYAHSLGNGYTNPVRFQGIVTGTPTCTNNQSGVFGAATGAISININNPFIPAATRTAMTNAGVTCISVGRTLRELKPLQFNDGAPFVWRGVAGLKGEFGENWSWDTYYQYGKTRSQQRRANNADMTKFRRGIDAVLFNGQVACRVNTDATTANDDAACVPINIFGAGSITPAMANYFLGESSLVNHITQQVGAANLRGEPLSTWAGPIALALGVEARKETIEAEVDANSAATLWQTGSRKAIPTSEIKVTEGYVETVIPLLKEKPLFEDLSLNAAARQTQYETSTGKQDVTTWKIGSTWDINEEFRVRATRSRDIRAGNLNELYTAAATSLGNVINRVTAANSPTTTITTGNPGLEPEQADTWTAGVVYSPGWLDGLRFSVDYYDIKIDKSILQLTAQQVVDRCQLENAADACAQITFNGTAITQVRSTFLNAKDFLTSGVDLEVSYRAPMDRFFESVPGNLSARILANYVDKLATTAAVGAVVTNPAGQYNNPHYTVFGNLGYDNDKWSVALDVRWYEGGTVDNALTCGAISVTGINICKVEASTYVYLSGSYRLDEHLELFGRINNALNAAPPFPSNGGAAGNISGGFFDEVGRAYRVGLRFKY